MPKYTYKATNESGDVVEGSLIASSKPELMEKLEAKHLIPIRVETKEDKQTGEKGKGPLSKIKLPFNRVKLIDILMIFSNMGTMLKAGLPMLEVIETLTENQADAKLKTVLETVQFNVENGKPLAETLKKYPDIFSKKMTAMIEIGEEAGNLDETVQVLASQLKKDYEIRKKVKGAMTYPIVVISAMLIIGTFLIVFMIPQLTGFIEGIGEIPATTKFLMDLSDFMQANIVYIVIGGVIVGYFFKRTMKKNQKFRYQVHKYMLKIPKFGKIQVQIAVSQICRSLGTLLHSGVPILEALKIVEENITSEPYKQAVGRFKESISKGVALGASMGEYPDLFPSLVSRMVAVGDKTGNSADMLINTADFYDTEVDDFLNNISSIIEPILLIVLGAGVLVLALGVVTPMYSVMGDISSAAR